RAVFLLHGFLGSARNLATLARGLTQRLPDRSAISLDLTGHGESPPLPPHPDLAIVARDVLETVRALEAAAPWTLIGHSLAGRALRRDRRRRPVARCRATSRLLHPRHPRWQIRPRLRRRRAAAHGRRLPRGHPRGREPLPPRRSTRGVAGPDRAGPGVTDAFYIPDGDDFVATVHTRGPWSPKHQHGGPPSALL